MKSNGKKYPTDEFRCEQELPEKETQHLDIIALELCPSEISSVVVEMVGDLAPDFFSLSRESQRPLNLPPPTHQPPWLSSS